MSDFSKKTKSAPVILSVILILITMISVLCIAVTGGSDARIVNIYSDGKLIWNGNLNSVTEDIILTVIPSSEGCDTEIVEGIDTSHTHYNVIRISREGVCVTDSDCKNKVCQHTGMISSPGIPIACLPNRLLITIISSSGSDADVYTY